VSVAAAPQPESLTAPLSALDALNAEQRQAAQYGVGDANAGPLLIIAGAGSGKTSTLAHRVAHLIERGADPGRLLLLTFSRRAAQELERRAATVLRQHFGQSHSNVSWQLPWAGTFHSIGARLLREYAESIGLSPSFTVHDRADSVDLMGLLRHERGLGETHSRFPSKGTCSAIYSRSVNSQSSLESVLRLGFPWCAPWRAELAALFDAYIAEKQRQQVLDYDDLLLYWSGMMQEPAFAAAIGARFDHVLVDEYQDTNLLQANILIAMKPTGHGVTVVGDDAQSIYAFRAATVRNILDFPNQFALPCERVTLERNYRSTQPILAACNAVIGLAKEGYAKQLYSDRVASQKPLLVTVKDDAAQANYLAERILAAREDGLSLKSQAVLFRTSSHSAALELELARRNIPFIKFGGLKFLEAAHIKDLLSALRFVENPRSRMAGFRLLQLMPGMGPKSAQKILDLIGASADPLAALGEQEPPSASAAPYLALLATLNASRGLAWPEEIGAWRRWYEPHLSRLYDDNPSRVQDLEQLERIAAGYSSRERFLTELTLDPPEASSDEAGVPLRDEDYLILSTIHSAKGQEWKAVYLLNAVDGCIPSDMATGSSEEIEEERRLLYVAMTRARDRLEIVVPQRFYVAQQSFKGDRHLLASRSRFLPDSVTGHFKRCNWPIVPPGSLPPGANSMTSIDLASRLRGTFTRGE
jgi:DNA helicase-2/ATP-dependent DNA helicase PcrA